VDTVSKEGFLELRPILVGAFAVPGGIFSFRDLVLTAIRFDIFDVCAETMPLGDCVRAVLEELNRRGSDDKYIVAQTLFTNQPGNIDLRAWVSEYTPTLMSLVSDSDFAAARGEYQKARSEGQSTLAKAGLNQLLQLAQLASVRQEIARRRNVLVTAAEQLNIVRYYKTLHDKLHLIQVLGFAELGRMQLKRELDDSDRAVIRAHGRMMGFSLPGIQQDISTLQSVQAPVEDAWLGRYTKAVERLISEEPLDRQALRSFSMELRSVLSNQLKAINQSLVSAAAKIDFRTVTQLLTVIAATLNVETSTAVERQAAVALVRAADAIEALGVDLQSTISVHSIWQDVDTLLWGFELGLAGAVIDEDNRLAMVSIWDLEFVSRLRELDRLDPGQWPEQRRNEEAAMGDTLDGDPPVLSDMRRCFETFAAGARMRFFEVDKLLLGRSTGIVALLPNLQAISRGDGYDN
jgi:hypothetical protein